MTVTSSDPRQWPASSVEMVALGSLIPYAKNARKHPEAQLKQIVASMQEFGWTIPVLRDEAGGLIAGHARCIAARRLGWKEAPTMTAVGWTEAQKRAYVIADNKLSLGSEWDEDMLVMELGDLSADGFDLTLTGFGEDELRRLVTGGARSGLTDPDSIPAVSDAAITKRGDVWLLGAHRLMCGDATTDDDVIRLMAGERAALFSTDPPYAVGYTGGQHPISESNRSRGGARNKNWSRVYHEADNEGDGEAFYDAFISKAISNAISDHAAWYCWHSSIRAPMVERMWNKHGAFNHQQIIWVKSRAVLTYSAYMWQHEPCLMGWIKGAKPPTKTRNTEFQTTVWSIPSSEVSSKDHPTSKPTKLFQIPMQVHTEPEQLCYEPFSGSGSQIIAAQIEGRRCYAMEISPAFVDVAIRRWEAFTGEHAILDENGMLFSEVEKERIAQAPDVASASSASR